MLETFIMLGILVAEPALVAQLSAVGSGKQVEGVESADGYDAVFTVCQDVQSKMPDSAHNSFGPPFHEDMYKRWGVEPGTILTADWVTKHNLKVNMLEAPRHGKVLKKKIDSPLAEANNPFWETYTFIPDKEYLGKDRIVFKVEANGKRYKLIRNFWVVSAVVDPKGDDAYVPDCIYQDFNDSSKGPSGE